MLGPAHPNKMQEIPYDERGVVASAGRDELSRTVVIQELKHALLTGH